MIDWPNAKSIVTLASNGLDTGMFLSIARIAWSHCIVQEAPKVDME
jgi:hypothetical protein